MCAACSVNQIEHMQLILQKSQIKTNGNCTLGIIRLPSTCSCQCNWFPQSGFVSMSRPVRSKTLFMAGELSFHQSYRCQPQHDCYLRTGFIIDVVSRPPRYAYGSHTTMHVQLLYETYRLSHFLRTIKPLAPNVVSCDLGPFPLQSDLLLLRMHAGGRLQGEGEGPRSWQMHPNMSRRAQAVGRQLPLVRTVP